jgi:tyrosyl-tRNA synthetase
MVNLKNFFTDLQKRGIIANIASLENFYQLKPSQKVIYHGIDCTGESLHIGHLFLLIQTIRFAKEGFQVLLILGGGTSKVGDPSDKLKERPQLETEKLSQYYQDIKDQVTRIVIKPPALEIVKEVNFTPLELFFSDNQELLNSIYKVLEIKKEESGVEKKWEKYLEYIWPLNKKNNCFQILNNDEWLNKISFLDFINQVGRNITINYLLAKETIKQRIENPETGLSFLAFSYSLLQAYDFYYLYKNYSCHGQVGGSDQWGNLTTGLELIKKLHPGEKTKTFAFTFPLLTDKEGKKFSKSSGSKTIWLSEKKRDPEGPDPLKELYNFLKNMPDEQVLKFLYQFTFLTEKQIEKIDQLNNPRKLRIPQRILIELLFYLLHGKTGISWLKKNKENQKNK